MPYGSERELIGSIRTRVLNAIDANAQSNNQRERAFRQFFLQPNGTEGEGRSAVQSADVNSMITAVQAQTVISFSTDTVVEYEADSAEDKTAAKAESQAVNKILMEQNGGFAVIRDAVQNALMYRDGYVKVWWQEDTQTDIVPHKGIEAADLPFALENEPGVSRRLISYDAEKKLARTEVVRTSKRLTCSAVANERFFFDPDWNEPSLVNCPLVGEVHYKTRNDLTRMGVEDRYINELKSVPRYSGSEGSEMKRRGRPESQGYGAVDKSTEVLRVFEVYALYAEDEDDNRAYLHKCWLGETGDFWLLEPEMVSRVPYGKGSAFPVANQAEGEALAEKLYWIQEGKTELLRQWIDNIRNCSWGRPIIVETQVNMDDILSPRAGGPIRAKRLDAVAPLAISDVGPSIQMGLQYFDQMRRERGGAAVDFLQPEAQLAQPTATGTDRVYAAAEIVISYMTRNLAESIIRDMFLLGHAELRAGQEGPLQLEFADQWISVEPKQWKPRAHCNVSVGYSLGERQMMSAALGQAIQLYLPLLGTTEGELTSKDGLYSLVTDFMQLALVDRPEKYFVNPQSPQAQQVGQQKAQMAQAAQAQQVDFMKAVEELKADTERYKVDVQTQFDYFKTIVESMQAQDAQEAGGAIEVLNAATQAEVARIAGQSGGGATAPGAQGGGAGNGGGGRAGPAVANGRANGAARN